MAVAKLSSVYWTEVHNMPVTNTQFGEQVLPACQEVCSYADTTAECIQMYEAFNKGPMGDDVSREVDPEPPGTTSCANTLKASSPCHLHPLALCQTHYAFQEMDVQLFDVQDAICQMDQSECTSSSMSGSSQPFNPMCLFSQPGEETAMPKDNLLHHPLPMTNHTNYGSTSSPVDEPLVSPPKPHACKKTPEQDGLASASAIHTDMKPSSTEPNLSDIMAKVTMLETDQPCPTPLQSSTCHCRQSPPQQLDCLHLAWSAKIQHHMATVAKTNPTQTSFQPSGYESDPKDDTLLVTRI